MKKYGRHALIVSICVIGFSLIGCKPFFDGFKEGLNSTGGSPADFKSNDGKWAFTADSSWNTRRVLKEGAAIQASNLVSDKYIIVLQENKIDFQKGISLKDYTGLVINLMRKNLTDPSSTPPVDITVNGMKARLFELSGSIDKTNLKYLVATVESKDSFHQLILWSLPSKYDSLKSEYMKIIESYRAL
jgi:hypothetical protein